MFSKAKQSSNQMDVPSPSASVKPSAPSIISADLRLVGDLSSDGEIQIDGTIEGDIRAKTLLVGETAKIKGEVASDSVRVHGNINGQIKAATVFLAKTAYVVGDVIHDNLTIETGAYLEGHCKHLSPPKEAAGAVNLVSKNEAKDAKVAPPSGPIDPRKMVAGNT